uniref:gamma-tubulin complex component 6-like n=1 Tax=Styela clava TaxID=7725 RepID=UPI001939E3BE|nr:gamma-tubulin complex component 6-like [Styela clava]
MFYAKEYFLPDKLGNKNPNGLYGLDSKVFSDKGLTDSAYEFDSQTRLYGGLRHSRTFDLDVKLSYPPITGPIDMMASLPTSMTSVDEGFVSPTSSIDFSDLEQDPASFSPHKSDSGISTPIVPYHGYRVPNYDLNVWKDCLKVKKSNHRTWETLGLPAGSTKREFYLTEAGPKMFDEIWKQRASVIHRLANFLDGGNLPTLEFRCLEESKLVKQATLVMMGVSSDTFQFNRLAQMFIPRKNIYFSGVDPEAVYSLLSKFSEWGTCYWRLVHFSALSVSTIHSSNPFQLFNTSAVSSRNEEKGVIFKAFTDAVRRYLHEFQHQILALKLENITLQKLSVKLRKAGAQIRYICQLCQCGDPDLPPSSPNIAENFPTGVQLLSYLYEEAVHCPEPNHYLALLYLLRKSCLPYLQFVQNWVFRGQCWDASGEFMLNVNADFGGARRDRLRWLKYIEPVDTSDPGSCVPSFLAPLAEEIYTCGKTVSLMQFISPEHFLVVDGVDTPDLEITFSKRKIQIIENEWMRHGMKMTDLEAIRTMHWVEKEEELKASAHKVAMLVRKAAKEEIVKMRNEIKQRKQERYDIKMKEFERLKKQAKDDAERRALEIQKEKDEDHKREEARQEKEKLKQAEENRLLSEEKEKLVSYYEELNMEAERRIRKAEWLKRRNRLHSERIKHSIEDKQYWRSEITKIQQAASINTSLVDVLADKSQGNPEKQHEVVTGRSSIEALDSTILKEFLDITLLSQAEEKSLETQTKMASDLERALQDISPQKPLSGVFENKDPDLYRPQTATGIHHVSEETLLSSNIEKTTHTKMVHGKSITQSHYKFEFNASNSDSNGPITASSRMIGEKNISQSSMNDVFDEQNLPQNSAVHGTAVKPVEGKNIADSNIGDLMGVGSATPHPENTTSKSRKSIPGQGVSTTTFDKDSTGFSTHIKISKDKKVSDSTMNQIIGGNFDTNDTTTKTFKKQVAGHGISKSSVGDLLTDSPIGDSNIKSSIVTRRSSLPDSVMGEILYGADHVDSIATLTQHPVKDPSAPNPSNSTVESLLYGDSDSTKQEIHKKKKVDGRNVSDSSVGDMMNTQTLSSKDAPSNQDIDRVRRFAIQNHIHGSHHSQSSIQNLMYYQDRDPTTWEKGEKKNTVVNVVKHQPPINSSKRHPSYSTLQLQMFTPLAIDEEEEIFKAEEKTFHLQLPSMINNYSDSLQPKLDARYPNKEDILPVDLLGNVVGKSFESEFEDEVTMNNADWRSDIDAVDMHALPVLLSQCIVRPIMQQTALANRCIINYFMVDMELPRHFEMLRHFSFMEDGEFGQILSIQLFEKMHSGCRPIDLLNPVILGSLITRAVQGSAQRNSPHSKRLTFSVQHLPDIFSTNDPSSLDCFTLKYDVGWPCNIVITEANQRKYGQVFGFLLKLKHVMWALHDVYSKLSTMGDSYTLLSESELRRLHLYRHEMQNFVKVMQGYVSTQVVHVCWHEFQDALKSAKCLEDLHSIHVEYLRKCVYRCLLTKKTAVIMNVITDVFKTILRFWTQLSTKSIAFSKLKHTYDNFQKFSSFLFKVVTKLVDRGYQPHLEDFLVRLNYNGFYKE